MNNYLFKLKDDLNNIISDLIDKKIINKNFNYSSISLDYLSKSRRGDASSNILILLKQNLKNNEFDITNEIKSQFTKLNYIEKIDFASGKFINFQFKKEYILKNLQSVFVNPSHYGLNNSGKNKKINIEFVSANPTGPLHIGHIRGAIFGDVLSSIMQVNGFEVTREYYVNDSGSQIISLGKSLFKRYQELNNVQISISNDEYPGDYLIDIAKKIFKSDGKKWLNDESEERKIYFQNYAVTEITKTIKDDLKLIKINFDLFTKESQILKENVIKQVCGLLEEKNLIYEGYLDKPKGDDNTNWTPRKQLLFKSSKFNDDVDRPFQKINGDWTYFANDSAYHYNKFLRKYDQLINIWGSDHIGYISRLKSIVEALSDKKNYLQIFVCQIVRLFQNNKLYKMSKREGNFITLNELVSKVGKDPLRYFMISSKSETPMDFDIDKVIQKNKDNPVFYCQYAYARASSIINKAKSYEELKDFENKFENFEYDTLTREEKEIILKILSWPYLLYHLSILKQPHKLANYIEDISSNFHTFWNMGKDDETLRMIDLDNINKTITKLIWIQSLRIVLNKAFEIIGIEVIENM